MPMPTAMDRPSPHACNNGNRCVPISERIADPIVMTAAKVMKSLTSRGFKPHFVAPRFGAGGDSTG